MEKTLRLVHGQKTEGDKQIFPSGSFLVAGGREKHIKMSKDMWSIPWGVTGVHKPGAMGTAGEMEAGHVRAHAYLIPCGQFLQVDLSHIPFSPFIFPQNSHEV